MTPREQKEAKARAAYERGYKDAQRGACHSAGLMATEKNYRADYSRGYVDGMRDEQ